MFTFMRKMSMAAALLAVVASASGCFLLLGAAAGAGGYAYVSGVLEKGYDVSAEALQDATLKGLKALEMPTDIQEKDRLSAKIRSVMADGNNVKIDVEAVTERTSKIRIRVGIIGNKSKSEIILNAIQKYL